MTVNRSLMLIVSGGNERGGHFFLPLLSIKRDISLSGLLLPWYRTKGTITTWGKEEQYHNVLWYQTFPSWHIITRWRINILSHDILHRCVSTSEGYKWGLIFCAWAPCLHDALRKNFFFYGCYFSFISVEYVTLPWSETMQTYTTFLHLLDIPEIFLFFPKISSKWLRRFLIPGNLQDGKSASGKYCASEWYDHSGFGSLDRVPYLKLQSDINGLNLISIGAKVNCEKLLQSY